MSPSPQFDKPQFDKRSLRRSFERAAQSYDAAAVLQHEVCKRMDERLDLIKHLPATILDAGSGTGNALPALRERYPKARVTALDLAFTMLLKSRARTPWWKALLTRPPNGVCGDIEQLPLAAASVDMVWSNLALQWVNDPDKAFAEFHRVLAPGGLLMFSTFGPDTLKELRAAYAGVDQHTHVSRFIDLHDIGDILVKRGFADPVMDMEPFTLTYSDVRALMHDLKAIGAHNVTQDRPPGLTGRARLAAVTQAYEPLRRDGKLPATFEVVYGHAWKPLPRVTAGGKRVIDIKPAAE
ncbi:MAG TPA: malonyl-ACP O-methyltransferase BioC [Burkholderiales bacterium]|nr:malonyl-ACP O-methyltransferase BioC [Burkholderiales bacterium]